MSIGSKKWMRAFHAPKVELPDPPLIHSPVILAWTTSSTSTSKEAFSCTLFQTTYTQDFISSLYMLGSISSCKFFKVRDSRLQCVGFPRWALGVFVSLSLHFGAQLFHIMVFKTFPTMLVRSITLDCSMLFSNSICSILAKMFSMWLSQMKKSITKVKEISTICMVVRVYFVCCLIDVCPTLHINLSYW